MSCEHSTRGRRGRIGMFMRAAVALTVLALAGCSSFGAKPAETTQADPNVYPADYRQQIAMFAAQVLTDRADFRGALIAPPAIKPVGSSRRFVVCVQFNGHDVRRQKVAVYLAGSVSQFVDAMPEQCGDAAFQPFPELAAMTPPSQ
jgi:hypothetical protein